MVVRIETNPKRATRIVEALEHYITYLEDSVHLDRRYNWLTETQGALSDVLRATHSAPVPPYEAGIEIPPRDDRSENEA